MNKIKLICSKFEYKKNYKTIFAIVKKQKTTGKQVGVAKKPKALKRGGAA